MNLTCAERLHDLDEMMAFEDAHIAKLKAGEWEEAIEEELEDDWELVTDEEMQRLELLYADDPSIKHLRAMEDALIVRMLWNSLGTKEPTKEPADEEWDIIDGSEIE